MTHGLSAEGAKAGVKKSRRLTILPFCVIQSFQIVLVVKSFYLTKSYISSAVLHLHLRCSCFTLGSTVHDWGWPKNGPFWTKNGQTWQACQRSKVVQRGPKGTKMVNLSLFDHLGPRLGPSGPFWTISDKNDFFAPNGQNRVLQRCFGAKYQFLFEMVQKGPVGSKGVPNGKKHLG